MLIGRLVCVLFGTAAFFASQPAQSAFTYDYSHSIAHDTTTGLYWRLSEELPYGSWNDATFENLWSLFSSVGIPYGDSGPARYSKATSDLLMFFSSNTKSPNVISSRLPSGQFGDSGFCPSPQAGKTCFGLSGFAQWSGPSGPWGEYDYAWIGYSGSSDIRLNDWVGYQVATIAAFSRDGSSSLATGPLDPPLGPYPVFQYSTVNPIPEAQTYALMLVGLSLLGVVARQRKRMPQ